MEIFDYNKQDGQNILNKDENKQVRRSTGQLNWLASQMVPNLSLDKTYLSIDPNYAKHSDVNLAKKAVIKAKQEIVEARIHILKSLKICSLKNILIISSKKVSHRTANNSESKRQKTRPQVSEVYQTKYTI